MYFPTDINVDDNMDAQSQMMQPFHPIPRNNMPNGLERHDSGIQMTPESQQWWQPQEFVPTIDTYIDQLPDTYSSMNLEQLSQFDDISPVDSYLLGDTSPGRPEWQEKVRAERRKVQNRAAQRAYRERKDKALQDLREMLDQKELEYQTLQKDHEVLREQYEKLLASKPDPERSSEASACSSRSLLSPDAPDKNTSQG